MSDTKTIIVSIPIMPHLCDSWRFEAPFGEFLSELEGVRLGIPLEFRETSRITISASGDYDGGHSIGDIEVTYSRPETEAERLERERSERERLLHQATAQEAQERALLVALKSKYEAAR